MARKGTESVPFLDAPVFSGITKPKPDLAFKVPIVSVPILYAAAQHKTPLCAPVAGHKVVFGQRHDKRQKLARGHVISGGYE
jgi:hypothetical protein